jgi:hypothetical protein
MTQARRRALLTAVIWTVVAIGFTITFLSSGGADTYAVDKARRVTGAVFLAIGFFGTPIMNFLTRGRRKEGQVVRDERDERIGRRAATAGSFVVLVYVFVVSIALWEVYAKSACVPVGWMWFLAYSTMILTYLASSVASLILDFGMLDHAEG